jgi:hypothetical protein
MTLLYATFVGGTVATVAMTLFSLLVSKISDRLYREPVLINVLLPPGVGKYNVAGYLLHLFVGWALALIYYFIIGAGWAVLSFQSGMIFGLIAGVVAIGVWKLLFKMSAPPPEINLIGYFAQLVVAHIIFGGVLAWVVLS